MALNLWTAPSCPSVGRNFSWKTSVAPPGRHWKLRWQFQWDGANKARVTLNRNWDYIFHSRSQFRPSSQAVYPHVAQTAENMLNVSCCATFYIMEKKKEKKWWWIIVPSLEKTPLKWKLFLADVSLSAESPAVKYCTVIQQRNLIRLSRDLEVGQNHIYQWLNLSLHSRGRISRMKQVFKRISAFWCKLLWLVGCLSILAAF